MPMVLDHLVSEAIAERRKTILDHYESRKRGAGEGTLEAVPYNPVEPDALYLSEDELAGRLASADPIRLSAYGISDAAGGAAVNLDVRARAAILRPSARAARSNVFASAVDHIGKLRAGRAAR